MISADLEKSLQNAFSIASELSHEYLTLEHLLLALTEDDRVISVLSNCGVNLSSLRKTILMFLRDKNIFACLAFHPSNIKPTLGVKRIIKRAQAYATISGIPQITSLNALVEIFAEPESYSSFFLLEHNVSVLDIIPYIIKSNQSFKPYGELNNGGISNNSLNSNPNLNSNLNSNLNNNLNNNFNPFNNINNIKSNEVNALEEYCINLNEQVLKGETDKLIGRNKEVARTINILMRRTKNNPIYVGDPGVGKTAIAEGLAYKIVNSEVPTKLKNIRIYSLKMGTLLAGTRYRGDFEERVKLILNEITNDKNIILFIDEIHTLVGAGATSGGSIDAGNLLKPFLTKGPLRCIGATTYKEYSMYFEKDAALARRFQKIEVEEPTVEDTIEILEGIKHYYESFHNVRYTKNAISEIVNLSDRYINDRALPDKAVDLMDELGSLYSAALFKNINGAVVRMLFSQVTGVSIEQFSGVNGDVIKYIEDFSDKLKQEIFGQNNIIEDITKDLKLAYLCLKNEQKPLGSYLFAGPTGVGKTELAKQIAQHLAMKLIRIDMSEYMEAHSVAKLIGSPPGYVGYNKGGILTELLSRYRYGVILFDEIEKAHRDVHNILLQMMDYGYITDSSGKKIRVNNTIIILTTNALQNKFSNGNLGFVERKIPEESKSLGFNTDNSNNNSNNSTSSSRNNNNNPKTHKDLNAAAINIDSLYNNKENFKDTFSSEFLNRLDLVLNFNHISKEALIEIANKTVAKIENKLKNNKNNNIQLSVNTKVIKHLAENFSQYKIGIRSMENYINNVILSLIVPELSTVKNLKLKLVLEDDNIKSILCD